MNPERLDPTDNGGMEVVPDGAYVTYGLYLAAVEALEQIAALRGQRGSEAVEIATRALSEDVA